jgi:hypothetical protein
MRKNDLQDPELAQFRHRSAPIPRTAIFGGEGSAVQRISPRSKKNLTEMGEWELGLSLPPHSGASRWSAMRAQAEVQPQVN